MVVAEGYKCEIAWEEIVKFESLFQIILLLIMRVQRSQKVCKQISKSHARENILVMVPVGNPGSTSSTGGASGASSASSTSSASSASSTSSQESQDISRKTRNCY